jgi:hypothetical protein
VLELRPNCEYCDKDLPPDSAEAMICTYECTYCRECVTTRLRNVCPTCGGGFQPRPIRPKADFRGLGLGLTNHPPSDVRKALKFSHEDIAEHVARIAETPPERR